MISDIRLKIWTLTSSTLLTHTHAHVESWLYSNATEGKIGDIIWNSVCVYLEWGGAGQLYGVYISMCVSVCVLVFKDLLHGCLCECDSEWLVDWGRLWLICFPEGTPRLPFPAKFSLLVWSSSTPLWNPPLTPVSCTPLPPPPLPTFPLFSPCPSFNQFWPLAC